VANLPSVSLTLVGNLLPVLLSTTLAKLLEKCAAGVIDTGGEFAIGVVPLDLQKSSQNFEKI
jgi:hypothetical protein